MSNNTANRVIASFSTFLVLLALGIIFRESVADFMSSVAGNEIPATMISTGLASLLFLIVMVILSVLIGSGLVWLIERLVEEKKEELLPEKNS